jgi:hypothetical protein
MGSDFKIYMLTFVLVVCAIGFIIPNLAADIEDLEKQTNTIVGTRIDQRERQSRSLEKKYEDILVVLLDNGGELRFSTYHEYWHQIEDPANTGKEITFYKHGGNSGINPLQVIIDNKVIYKKGTQDGTSYLLLAMTAGCVIYSFYSIRRRLKGQAKAI